MAIIICRVGTWLILLAPPESPTPVGIVYPTCLMIIMIIVMIILLMNIIVMTILVLIILVLIITVMIMIIMVVIFLIDLSRLLPF